MDFEIAMQRLEPREKLQVEDFGGLDCDENRLIPSELLAKRIVGDERRIILEEIVLGGGLQDEVWNPCAEARRKSEHQQDHDEGMRRHDS